MSIPAIGDKIYIRGAMYVYRGKDDRIGGIATISKIQEESNNYFIEVEEIPGVRFNYKHLQEEQQELKEQYGDQKARPDPDDRPQFNDPNEGWRKL
jgi:hypothetical protein